MSSCWRHLSPAYELLGAFPDGKKVKSQRGSFDVLRPSLLAYVGTPICTSVLLLTSLRKLSWLTWSLEKQQMSVYSHSIAWNCGRVCRFYCSSHNTMLFLFALFCAMQPQRFTGTFVQLQSAQCHWTILQILSLWQQPAMNNIGYLVTVSSC